MERHTHDVSEITRPAASGFNPAKLIGILVAIGMVRAIASHKIRGHAFGPMASGNASGGRWAGRRAAIADFHRQLHEQDAEAAAGTERKGDPTI